MSKPIDQEREAFAREYDAICNRPITQREIAWRMWQARAAVQPAGVAVPQMVDFSPVPDDFRNQATGYRAGWNDCRAMLAAAPHPVSGEQTVASVSTGVDTLKWWRQLVDLNPADLAPRLDAALAAHRDHLAQQGEQPS